MSLVAMLVACPLHAQGTVRDRAGQLAERASTANAAEADDATGPEADILVTAPRRGEAVVAAETELGEGEIAAQGAATISDLLERLGPLVDPSGGEPVILVNGKEVGFDRSILAYPPEALERLGLLGPGAAARYGHPAGKRVINLVLKPSFVQRSAELAGRVPTRGGRHGGDLQLGQVAITGESRWHAQARLSFDGPLHESARGLSSGAVDLAGHVRGLAGEEIDPALSALAGRIVTVAPLPRTSGRDTPALPAFLPAQDAGTPAEGARYATLLPATRNLSVTLGLGRPLGPFSATASLTATASKTVDERGLPEIATILPAESRWSPFARDVVLSRPLDGDAPLRGENAARSLALALALSGPVAGWRTNLSATYVRNRGRTLQEEGIDTARVAAMLGPGGSLSPYRPWSRSLLRASRSRSASDMLGMRLSAAKPIFALSGAPVSARVTLDGSHAASRFVPLDRLGNALAGATRTAHRRASGEISLAVPLARRGEGGLVPLGDLALDLSAGFRAASGSALRRQYGAGFTWAPFAPLRLSGSFEHSETVPSNDDLGAPRVETVRRVYDFERQEIAEPLWITGGNPALGPGTRRSLSLAARLQPLGSPVLALDVRYRRNDSEGGVAPFPDLTPATEAVFPERVTRDAAGRLVAVDARPINLARSERRELASGIAVRLPDPAGGAAAGAVRYTLSVNHTWKIADRIVPHAGLAPIDRLAANGQSRHVLSARASAGRKTLGLNLQASWSSPARVRSASGADGPGGGAADYRYRPPLRIDLGLFVEPAALVPAGGPGGALRDLRLSLDVENLFDTYRRVTLSGGSPAPGFARYQVDPLGRQVTFSLRKTF